MKFIFLLLTLVLFLNNSIAQNGIQDAIECYKDLDELQNQGDYQEYEKKLVECLNITKHFKFSSDILSNLLYLNFKSRQWSEDSSVVEEYYRNFIIHKIGQTNLMKLNQWTLDFLFETLFYYNYKSKDAYIELEGAFLAKYYRNLWNDKDLMNVYESGLRSRRFDRASILRGLKVLPEMEPIPQILNSLEFNYALPGHYSFTGENNSYLLKNYNLVQKNAHVIAVVSTKCGFTLRAIKELEHYKDIVKIIRNDGIFIVPQVSYEFQEVEKFNKENPLFKIYISFQDKKWNISGFGKGFPFFYFIKNNEVKFLIKGHNPKKFIKDIKKGLTIIGLL